MGSSVDGKGFEIAINQVTMKYIDPLTYFKEQVTRLNMVM